MNWVVTLIIHSVIVFVTARILPGVVLPDLMTAILVAVVMGVINTFVKPVLTLLTLPLNFLSLGLFTFILNAFIVMLVDYLIPTFSVPGFIAALLFAIIVSLLNTIVDAFQK
ncbi:MAG: Membrane protein of unknown function [Microgenomates bacterium OLB22]|nr:MAG: Membrane protein of unknown function [Microgenomates bacterium OLB22]